MASEADDVRATAHRRWWRVGGGWIAVLVLAVAIAIVGTRSVGSTFAAGGFTAHNAYKTSTITSGSLTGPTSLSAHPSGKSIDLTWTRGATSNKTKQIVGVDHTAATTACTTSSTFTTLTANVSKTAATYADAIRLTTGTTKAGDWYCYQVTSAYDTSWTKAAASPVHAQAGFVATAATVSTTLTQTTTAGKIDTATVTITFNQKIGTTITSLKQVTGVTTGVCALATTGSEELLLGATSSLCKATTKVTLGILESSVNLSLKKYYTKLTWSVTNTTTSRTYTVSVKFSATTYATIATFTGTPTWTFVPGTPSTRLPKSSTTSLTVCRTNAHAASLCQPSVTSKTL